ncbi:hypothetical protein AFE02nite_12230 [Actinotalea fermentans]|uniref:Uncharacterized protein n=1 Tax=Actinotalea fermentans TaxID=43671 RepID=A0A511YWE5_9CELL|nr:hypothetical protein AFE02nite_12230 [Actinotalea fermentans]
MTTLRVIAPPGGWAPPWPVVIEIASVLPPRSWVLVGGLMVQLHARAAGVEGVRPTRDVDALIDVMAAGVSMAGITGALTARGFAVVEPGWPESPVHRLRRDGDVIDVLVADHLPRHAQPRLHRRPVMAIDGGAQALARTQQVVIEHEGGTVEVAVPDLLGALVLKAAAHIADRRDRERHLRDAGLLASLIADHRRELGRLQGSDRKRLRHLAEALSDPLDDAWLLLPDDARQRGQDTLRILSTYPARAAAPEPRY